MISAGTAVAYLTLDHSKFSSGLKGAGQDFKTFMDSTQKGTDRVNALSSSLTGAGKTLTKSVTAPLLGAGVLAGNTAIKFESAFTGVRKTVDATEKQFSDLEKGIRNMAKTMPTSANEIAGVAEAAGQLGIQTEKIEEFTKTMVMLGDSTNLSSDQAATTLARLANITGMSQDKFGNLGSVIVALGNNLATTEAEITEMGLRLAGAGSQVGMTEAQILSFSGALSSVGIEAEAGGSAFSKVMIDMQLATETGGEALSKFAKVAGMSSNDFKKAFKEDAAGAMIQFIKGLSETEKKGVSAIKVLDDMGITEVRMRDALLRAAGASDVFTDAISLGNKAWDENSALTKEAETRYGTTESKLEILKNKFKDVGISLGQTLLPHIQAFADKLGKLVDWFGNLDEGTQKSIVKFAALAAAAGPVLIVTGKLVGGVTSLFGAGKKLVGGIGKIPGLIKNLPGLVSKVGGGFSGLTSIFGGTAAASTTVAKGVAGAGVAAKGLITPASMAAASMGEVGVVAKIGTMLFNPWTAAIVAAGAGAVVLGKKLKEEVVPEVDLFEDSIKRSSNGIVEGTEKISEGTKKAVESYMKMDDEASRSLLNMKMNGETITPQIASTLTTQFKQMSSTIVTELESDYKTNVANLQKMFQNSTTITAEEQSKMLGMLKTHYESEKTETENANVRIQTILNNASSQNRALTASELEEITRLKNSMRENAVQCLADQEYESKIILDRMAAYDGRVTAEVAGEHVRLLEEQRVKAIDTANREYEDRMRVARDIRAQGGKEAEETANKIIAEAERQRNETIKSANDIKEQGLDKLSESYKDLRDDVDVNTGEILSFWERMKKSLSWKPDISWFVDGFKGAQTTRNESRGIGGYATGTRSAKPGLHWVGEEGPELMNFKGGEVVYNAEESRQIARSISETGSISVSNVSSRGSGNSENNIIGKLDKLLSEKVNGEFRGKVVLPSGEEIGEVIFPFISNKLAIASMEVR